jgi:RNA polymerase sigma-70 factor (ECF subfamily)
MIDKTNANTSRGAQAPKIPAAVQSAQAMDAEPERPSQLESTLIERVRAGEAHLFYDLISPYERAVYLTAISVLRNKADAEEIAQESFLKAFVNFRRFRAQSKFSTWLMQIALNAARSRRRKDRKALFESTDATVEQEGYYQLREFADWRDTPVEALQRDELRRALDNAVAFLNGRLREVFMLRDVEGLTIAETANALQVTEALVKTRLLRARLKLRDALGSGLDGSWHIEDGQWTKVRPW